MSQSVEENLFRTPIALRWSDLDALNHGLSALVGAEVAGFLEARWFRWAVALGFVAMAGWILVPDALDDEEEPEVSDATHWLAAFLSTAIALSLIHI